MRQEGGRKMTNKHQGAKPLYTPKGSMCIACTHKARECKHLPFATMLAIERLPAQVVVRCWDFARARA